MPGGDARKKLETAALRWLGVAKPKAKALTVNDSAAEGLRRFGVSEAQIAAQRGQEPEAGADDDEVFEVYEDGWDSWLVFLKVQRQWLFVPVSKGFGTSARRYSMNWPGVEAVFRLAGIRRALWPELFADLQLIERTVLEAESDAA